MAVPEEEMDDLFEEYQGIEDDKDDDDINQNIPLLDFLDKGNIVEELGDDNGKITNKIQELFATAKSSMKEWLKKYKRALNLAKLQPTINGNEVQSKNTPFQNASMIMLPFITEAQLDFNSRSAPELAWGKTIVKPKTYGDSSQEKTDRSKRTSDYFNFQISELMPLWRSEQDKLLFNIPATGTAYKLTSFDYEKQETTSDLYTADKVIFDHDYPTFEESPDRFIEREYSKNKVIGFIRGEQGWKIDEEDLPDDDEMIEFIEAHTWIDLDEDGLKEPYIAIISVEKNKIVSLYPEYDEDTIIANDSGEIVKVDRVDCFTQYRFLPDPEGGPMGLGWGILLGPMFDGINTTMRQLMDAGTLHINSSNSGLINKRMSSGRGNTGKMGKIEIEMGKLSVVETNGTGRLADDIFRFPFDGPNPVLFQLLGYLVDASRSMTNAAVNVQAQPNEAAVMYLAKLNQGLMVPNSINMRIHDCAKKEIEKIALINHKHFDDEKYNRILDLDKEASMENDFNPDDMDLRLVSDPTQGSAIERIQRAQAVIDEAKDPTKPTQVIDYRQAVISKLEVMGVEDIEKIVPPPVEEDPDPMQQMLIAQNMADLENTKRANELRSQENEMKAAKLRLEQQKQAMTAAKEMEELGIKNDELEAKITKLYMESLQIAVDMGFGAQEAVEVVSDVESTFIDGKSTDFDYDPFTGRLAQRV